MLFLSFLVNSSIKSSFVLAESGGKGLGWENKEEATAFLVKAATQALLEHSVGMGTVNGPHAC